MDKKYQVFVSSTFTDLVEERKKVIDILLMSDCIPACMEAFVATDVEQFAVIKKIIDLCDYYVLILGKRYGSVNQTTGISYTEMEYDYAISKNIPVLVFSLDDSTETSPEKAETDTNRRAKLEAFRAKAMNNRLASIWHSIDDLASKFAVSIMKAKYEICRPGWQRDIGYDEESRRRQMVDLQRTLNLLAENQMLHEDLESLRKREKNWEKKFFESRRYMEYEGKWIQYIPDFSRTYAVCELVYKDGGYQFNGFNLFSENREPIRFDSNVVNLHLWTKEDNKSFCYITDASEVGKIPQKIRGFGEVAFLDTHNGHGYFFDVASAKGETGEKALQEYIMVKHDEFLYKRLGLDKTAEQIEEMDFKDICGLVDKHKDAVFSSRITQ